MSQSRTFPRWLVPGWGGIADGRGRAMILAQLDCSWTFGASRATAGERVVEIEVGRDAGGGGFAYEVGQVAKRPLAVLWPAVLSVLTIAWFRIGQPDDPPHLLALDRGGGDRPHMRPRWRRAVGGLLYFTGPGRSRQAAAGRGLEGQVFNALKLRFMYIDAEARTGAVWGEKTICGRHRWGTGCGAAPV